MHEMDKIKFLEFEVLEGHMLFIPPYWWYSIKYTSEADTLVCGFTYSSIMNCVANSTDITKYYLQQHNIKKRIVKTLEITEKQNEIREEVEKIEEENSDPPKPEPQMKQLQDIIV
jgi:ribosomal protein L16 Arg81 hydroxylase